MNNEKLKMKAMRIMGQAGMKNEDCWMVLLLDCYLTHVKSSPQKKASLAKNVIFKTC